MRDRDRDRDRKKDIYNFNDTTQKYTFDNINLIFV